MAKPFRVTHEANPRQSPTDFNLAKQKIRDDGTATIALLRRRIDELDSQIVSLVMQRHRLGTSGPVERIDNDRIGKQLARAAAEREGAGRELERFCRGR